MKKIFFILLTLVLSMLLIACGASSINEGSDTKSEDTVLTWPKDKLGSVPELKGITITEITDIENGVMITFEGCDENETKRYNVKLMKEWEFTTHNSEEGKTVYFTKQNESLIFFSPIYDDNNDIGSITYTITD